MHTHTDTHIQVQSLLTNDKNWHEGSAGHWYGGGQGRHPELREEREGDEKREDIKRKNRVAFQLASEYHPVCP